MFLKLNIKELERIYYSAPVSDESKIVKES